MLNRRDLIKGMAVGTLATRLLPVANAAPYPRLRMRRNIATMALDDPDLVAWRTFVADMRARDQTAAVSWSGFASVHGDLTTMNHCQHGNWYFLPWHRAFLMMYEKAVIEHSGKADFALPYWDWTRQRGYPVAFTERTWQGRPNPLFSPAAGDDPRQRRRGTLSLADAEVGTSKMQEIFEANTLENFGGGRPFDESVTPPKRQDSLSHAWLGRAGTMSELESTPHNGVHVQIGGYMELAASARDPLFFLHHCNVDRLWENWNLQGGINTNDPLWREMEFKDHFLDMRGNRYSYTVNKLQRAAGLGYAYDDQASAVAAGRARQKPPRDDSAQIAALYDPSEKVAGIARARTRVTGVAAVNAPLSMTLTVPAHAATPGKRVFAILRGVKSGPQLASMRVFVELAQPRPGMPVDDRHFVATTNFFAVNAHSYHSGGVNHGHCYSIELTHALARLNLLDLQRNTLTLQIVPILKEGGRNGSDALVTPGTVDIGIL